MSAFDFVPEIIRDKELNINNDDVDTYDLSKDKDKLIIDIPENIDINDTKLAIKKIGSKTFRTKIIEEYVRPNMIDDIKNCFFWRKGWTKIATISFCVSEILSLIQTGLAFSAASFDLQLISYLSGIVGVLCIAFNRFGSYSKNESSEKTNQLNEILSTVGIKDKIPDLMDHEINDEKNK
jgi:hypothetical protein